RTHKLYEEEMKKRQEEDERKKDMLMIEDEDVKILNEFEERMEVGGDDIAKIKLFGAIQEQGFEYYRDQVPLGIHSGLVNLEYSGILVVVCVIKESVEQLFWIYYSDDEDFREKLNHTFGLLIRCHPLCDIFKTLIEKNYVATSEFIRKLEKSIEKPEDDNELEESESEFDYLIKF
ncbi:unnamed protein product, partial [marine sediment metagenome]